MLTANRFTSTPTKTTRLRLEQALSNAKPISRGERHRSSVAAIQAALADLNRDYLFSEEVTGYFGSRTYTAVEAFQRDYGLIADGKVGKQTIAQLDALYSSDIIRKPMGVSLHIGVDRVNADHYGGDFALPSCVNDARKMAEFATQIGYDTLVLVNEEATTLSFTHFLRNAIENLYEGDSLLVTFSGHGSQIPNMSNDMEADFMDETLCFYDRMLIDDELYSLLGELRAGVRVHLVFDSCHSGTAAKTIESTQAELIEYKSLVRANTNKLWEENELMHAIIPVAEDLRPISVGSLSKALDGEGLEFAPLPSVKKNLKAETEDLFARLYQEENFGKPKRIRDFNSTYRKNQLLYESVAALVGRKENQQLRCYIVSLSACHDNQQTLAGSILSLFTTNIEKVWSRGDFLGSYEEFHRAVLNCTERKDVTPKITTYGGNRGAAMAKERPFFI